MIEANASQHRPGARVLVPLDSGVQPGIVRGVTVDGDVVVTVGQRAYVLHPARVRAHETRARKGRDL